MGPGPADGGPGGPAAAGDEAEGGRGTYVCFFLCVHTPNAMLPLAAGRSPNAIQILPNYRTARAAALCRFNSDGPFGFVLMGDLDFFVLLRDVYFFNEFILCEFVLNGFVLMLGGGLVFLCLIIFFLWEGN